MYHNDDPFAAAHSVLRANYSCDEEFEKFLEVQTSKDDVCRLARILWYGFDPGTNLAADVTMRSRGAHRMARILISDIDSAEAERVYLAWRSLNSSPVIPQ